MHPFFSGGAGAGGGTMGPLSREGNGEADGSKKLSYYLQRAATTHVDFVCLEPACAFGSQCVRTGYLHLCLPHPACPVLIHLTPFLHAGRYMSRLWRRQRRPVLLTPTLKLIFSLASALTFTSPPARRQALDVPPVAFFIPGADECVYVLARLCLKRTVFSIDQRKRTWVDLEKSRPSTDCARKRAIPTGGLI